VSSLYERALAVIPGGVDSPVRSFTSVGGEPFFVERAEGAFLVDTDGRRYVDFVQSWGASILGHAHPKVVEAVQRAASAGTSYGAATAREVELAEAIVTRLVDAVRADPATEIAVDVEQRLVTAPGLRAPFALDDHARSRLLAGLDDIAVTLLREADITAYEKKRPEWLPKVR